MNCRIACTMASNKPIFEDKDASQEGHITDSPLCSGSNEDVKAGANHEYHDLGFWTRMGCTPESFKQRTTADKQNGLNQTLRSRHMHMIAIGMHSINCPSLLLPTPTC